MSLAAWRLSCASLRRTTRLSVTTDPSSLGIAFHLALQAGGGELQRIGFDRPKLVALGCEHEAPSGRVRAKDRQRRRTGLQA